MSTTIPPTVASTGTADPVFTSIRYLPTNEAYDRWAASYDSDGNFLQAMDDVEMVTLLPRLLSSIKAPRPWKVVDLGCGTGRNTARLVEVPRADIAEVVALDASRGMLDVARDRLAKIKDASQKQEDKFTKLSLEVFDMLTASSPPAVAKDADAVVSTLVIEHIPLGTFFSHVSQLLKPGGVLLLTNMHAHMGGISQAGFVDTVSGEKIRPTSYAHTVVDTVAEAAKWGLVPGDGGIEERAVDEDMVEKLGARSGKWVGITCWFGGLFRKI